MARTIDLELTRAEVEVRELEARLRVVPMNDNQLSDALRMALVAKKERLEKLRALHAAGSRPRPQRPVPGPDGMDGADGDDGSPSRKIPVHGGHRTPLKRTIPQRSKTTATTTKGKSRK
jgi:hypothetical protein